MLALDRLVGVGDGAKRDHLGLVARIGKRALQQPRGVDLGVELGLEIEPRRVAEVGMRWPRVAVDAAVLAAPIGVDRLVEAYVGAVVGGDDALGRLARNLGLERLQLREALPAVIEGLAQLALVAACAVRPGATATAPRAVDQGPIVGHRPSG